MNNHNSMYSLPPWLGWPIWNICVTNDHGYVPLVVSTSRSFSHSRFITWFVTRLTRRVPLVELLTLPEHLNSLPGFSEVRVTRSFHVHVCRSLFVLFLLAIVLFVLLRFTDYNYPFGIFKLFLWRRFQKSFIMVSDITNKYPVDAIWLLK